MKLKLFVNGAALGAAGVLLLGASLAFTHANAGPHATRVRPDKTSITCSKSTYCFTVKNNSSGNAIAGEAGSGSGLYGLSVSSVGVWGQSTSDFGIYGTSQYTAGVDGYSQSSNGVSGGSSSGNGIYGTSGSASGVYGTSQYGYGVSGLSSSSLGVYGQSTSNDGVYGGSNSGSGIGGESQYGSGIYGYSGMNTGVTGYGAQYGGWFESGSSGYDAIYGQTNEIAGYVLTTYNASNGSTFDVDYAADGYFDGSVTASAFYTHALTRGRAKVQAFIPEATRATIEDTGTARLTEGQGIVRFDPTFASAIDASRGYQVFLTPNGDTRGLFVSTKYERGFIVREVEHGRSSLAFDYRVVAHPFGSSDASLPPLQVKPPPAPRGRPLTPPLRP